MSLDLRFSAVAAGSPAGAQVPVEPELHALRMLQSVAGLTSLPLMAVDVLTGNILSMSEPTFFRVLPPPVRRRLPAVTALEIVPAEGGLQFFLFPLPDILGMKIVAAGYVFSRSPELHPGLLLAATEAGWSREALNDWLGRQFHCHPQLLQALLTAALRQLQLEQELHERRQESAQLADQLQATYEELHLLHTLTKNLQVSEGPHDLAHICLERLRELVHCEGAVIWMQERDARSHFLRDGQPLLGEDELLRLVACFERRDWSRPAVRNKMQHTLLGAEFPGLRDFILAPAAQGIYRYGWIICYNSIGGQHFGTVEANLINSMASILGTHLRNVDLYGEHEELLLSFVRSLVSTLEAKDPYTRGHSERVALIARCLGEQLALPAEDLETIYLSGLLHDIGKIGVDDHILRKPAGLTEAEFTKVKEHPVIGYEILKGLKNLQHVLPGVRSHHESWDGSGYPDGLKREEIPLMARILAVADAYDAMISNRPYRPGMPLSKVEAIFLREAGQQWDLRIIRAYFQVRDAIQDICENYTAHPDSFELHPGNWMLGLDEDCP